MKNSILVCFLVGCVVAITARSEGAWKLNNQYQYRVHGRTLSALHDVADQYTGILIRADLKIQPLTEGKLSCLIVNPEEAHVHVNLPEGWSSYIPEEQLHYKPLALSNKRFEVVLVSGIVKELIVSSDVSEWEVNLIKSFLSQIQVDLKGHNLHKSSINQKAEINEFSANFKVMEPTVTGNCLTMYHVMPAGEHILQHNPELVPLPELKGNGKIIRVLKTKDYSHCKQMVESHYALDIISEAHLSRKAEYLTREAKSEIYVSGKMEDFVIQSSKTVNKIIVNPIMASEQKGMVVSAMNMTLTFVKPIQQQPEAVLSPISAGNLLYSDITPSEMSSRRQIQKSLNVEVSDDEDRFQLEKRLRFTRSVSEDEINNILSDEDSSEERKELNKQHHGTQPLAKLNEAPAIPLLQKFALELRKELKPVETCIKIVKEIAEAMLDAEKLTKENTLSRFSDLITVVRQMNFDEMKTVYQQLYSRYTQNLENAQFALEWKIFRDAVAQTGTGPALMSIKAWIEEKIISYEEAAEVLAVLPRCVQQPSEEYMRALYALVTSRFVQEQSMLNDTAILTFTEIVRLTYVDQEGAKVRYSMHYFHNIESESSKADFVKKELIPFLAKQLQEAIDHDDSHKAQVYIRALGNVADKLVYAVFKPYLEGERPISEFQRVLIIMSMDQLAKMYPQTTRNILYKIIINNGESSQVRVASVYQIMRTYPHKSMLKALASLTHTDPSKHVRAAIKSSIESATKFHGPKYEELRLNAESAVKLLTPETFGMQYAYNFLSSFMVKSMPMTYKQSAHSIFSEDSIYPNHIHYTLRLIEGDVSRQYINVAAMISSIKSLTRVVAEQFPEYPIKGEQMDRQWADKIAKLLNIEMDETKKLEGNLLFKLFGAERFLTMDNRTVERIPALFEAAIKVLQSGKRFDFTKLYVDDEMQVAFPTEMSFVFIYSLRRPSLIKIGGKLEVPMGLNAEAKFNSEIRIMTADTTESKIGFITPHDKKYYIAGYTKNIVLNLPLSVQVAIKSERVNIAVGLLHPEQNEQILHVSTWPYTYNDKIVSEAKGSLLSRAHVIHRRSDETFQTVFGKDNGIAFKFSAVHEKDTRLDWHLLKTLAEKYGFLFPLVAPIREPKLTHSMFELQYVAGESTSRAVLFDIAWTTKRNMQSNVDGEIKVEDLYAIPVEEQEVRQREFLNKVCTGLKTATASVYDVAVKFEGQKPKYVATLALASNGVEDRYQQLWYLFRSPSSVDKKFQMYKTCITKTTTAPKLNFIEALRADSRSKTNVQVRFGEEPTTFAELNMKINHEKSDERRQMLEQSSMAQLCKFQMEKKQFQHPVCANLTIQAQMMDRVYMEFNHKNIDAVTKNMTSKLLTLVRHLGYDYLEQNDVAEIENENTIRIFGQLEPEYFETVNVTIEAPKSKSFFKNIRVSEWVRPLLVVSPEYLRMDTFQAQYLRQVQDKSMCVLEKNSAVTFNNKTYPVTLGNCYHALLNIPLVRKSEEYKYGYTVLVRDSAKSSNLKDLKIVYNNNEVYQVMDLVAVTEQKYEVYVNDKIINIPTDDVYIVKDNIEKPWARIVFKNNELKIDFDLTHNRQMDDLTIIYNGERVKVMINDKFHGEVRGLCGTFSGESWYDYITPRNTMIQDSSLFAASFALVDETCQGPAKEINRLALASKTVRRETIFTRVVSEKDYYSHVHEKKGHCSTKHQTRYTIENGDKTICFTTRALPVCSSGCRSDKTVEKTVGVHCLQRTNTVNLYKKQIDHGANPDFSNKAVTKTIKIRVPHTCN